MKTKLEPVLWGLAVVVQTVLTILVFIKSGEVEPASLAMVVGASAMFKIALLEARQ